jgi:hypothetical protein
LLVLLPVFAGLPGSEQLFSICCLVVLLSVVVHGGSPMLLGRRPQRRAPVIGAEAPEVAIDHPLPVAPAVPDPSSDGHVAVAEPTQVTSTWAPAELPGPIKSIAVSADDDGEASIPFSESLTIPQLRRLWEAAIPVVILDVRTDRTYELSSTQAHQALRLPPEHVAEQASERNLPRDAWLVAYCA